MRIEVGRVSNHKGSMHERTAASFFGDGRSVLFACVDEKMLGGNLMLTIG